MPGKAAKVTVTEKQHAILLKFAKAKSSKVSLAQRSRIILLAFEGHNNEAIEKEVGLQHDAVGVWRRRWRDNWQRLIEIECAEKPHVLPTGRGYLRGLPRSDHSVPNSGHSYDLHRRTDRHSGVGANRTGSTHGSGTNDASRI